MNGLVNMRIGKRLMLAFGVLTVLTLGMTVVSLWAQSAIDDMNDAAVRTESQAYLATRAQRDVDWAGRQLAVSLLGKDKALKEERLELAQTAREHYKKRIE